MRHFSFLIFFISSLLPAQNSTQFFQTADSFFKAYVDNGKVKYAEIKQNPKLLNNLLEQAKKVAVSPEMEQEFIAFWVNAYNIAVIHGIIKFYPVDSPMDIAGFFDLQKHELGHLSLSLDEIEHEILFKNFPEESRLHFVLNCAAKSCPPLFSGAYLPATLEDQLQRQTKEVLNDPEFIRIKKNKVLFSKIMKWYQNDFTRNSETLVAYVNRYRNSPISDQLPIDFYEYNWDLNE